MEKRYLWKDGAELEEHTRHKLKILREYFARYLKVRCARPQQTKFRLAVVEGFARPWRALQMRDGRLSHPFYRGAAGGG